MAWWRGQDSNLRSPSGRQIYSLVALTTHPPLHADGTNPVPDPCVAEPQRGLEPLACRLQVDCANRLRHWGASHRQPSPDSASGHFLQHRGSLVLPDTTPASPGPVRFCRQLPYRLRRKPHIVNTILPPLFEKSPIPAPRQPPTPKRRPPPPPGNARNHPAGYDHHSAMPAIPHRKPAARSSPTASARITTTLTRTLPPNGQRFQSGSLTSVVIPAQAGI